MNQEIFEAVREIIYKHENVTEDEITESYNEHIDDLATTIAESVDVENFIMNIDNTFLHPSKRKELAKAIYDQFLANLKNGKK